MTSQIPGEFLQASVLRAYTTLLQLRSDWGGAFVLSLGLSSAGTALPIASNIAGAVSLSIDHNPDHIRAVVRSGVADFVVNSLDEAIRVMKNEIRKRTPLSVVLHAPPIATLNEILARGLAPQLFSSFLAPDAEISTAADRFHSLGAERVSFADPPPPDPSVSFRESTSILEPLLTSRSWQLRTFSFQSSADLRAFDSLALTMLPPDDILRRHWIDAARRVLQRQRPPRRCLWLSRAEEEVLTAGLSTSTRA